MMSRPAVCNINLVAAGFNKLGLMTRQQNLPKEQWTKHEEDKFYLEPYLKEVIWERKERRMDEEII
ncbi:hypothetical protein QTO34_013533, partial [Cnephaeus nilssonii]